MIPRKLHLTRVIAVLAGRLRPDLDAAQAYARRYVPELVASMYAEEYARLAVRMPAPAVPMAA